MKQRIAHYRYNLSNIDFIIHQPFNSELLMFKVHDNIVNLWFRESIERNTHSVENKYFIMYDNSTIHSVAHIHLKSCIDNHGKAFHLFRQNQLFKQ